MESLLEVYWLKLRFPAVVDLLVTAHTKLLLGGVV